MVSEFQDFNPVSIAIRVSPERQVLGGASEKCPSLVRPGAASFQSQRVRSRIRG